MVLDILIKPDAGNTAAVYTALTKFGGPLEGLGPDDFIERGKFFRMGTLPVMVDILPEIAGAVSLNERASAILQLAFHLAFLPAVVVPPSLSCRHAAGRRGGRRAGN
jgi:hypothetical protein